VKEFAMADRFNAAIVEAEENFLIDCQFLLQEVLTRKGMTLSQLAEKAGVSKSRISQVMSPEANPTVKTFARLFHALGEEILVHTMSAAKAVRSESKITEFAPQPWNWTTVRDAVERASDSQLVTLVKDTSASNDNNVVVMESELMITLEAA
jgi:transcriptional regulator with XRE-family HTH domain